MIDVLLPEDEKEEIEDLAQLLGQKKYETNCSRCGKKTDVPFEPTEGRPAYCRDCYQIVKEQKKKAGQVLVKRPRTHSGQQEDNLKVAQPREEEEKQRLVPPPLST
jgi:CxxC-x17-CxxC domain-containing protein